MANKLVEYQLRIRDQANATDALTVTNVRGGTNPYLSSVPDGDGASLDPLTGKVTSGNFTGRIVDPITSGTSRLFTSQLEDAGGRQQLGKRRAFWEFREDGGAWQNLYAGYLSAYRLTSDIEWEVVISDWMQAEHEYTSFDKHPSDTVAAYLARWPNRGCILGGPVLGTPPLLMRNLGGWQFKVGAKGTGYTRLDLVKAYYPDGIVVTSGELPDDLWNAVNQGCAPFFAPTVESITAVATGAVDTIFGSFPDLAILVDGGSGFSPYVATNGRNAAVRTLVGFRAYDQEPDHLLHRNAAVGAAASIYLDGDLVTAGPFALNQLVRVHVVSTKVTEASPIYWSGHPVDLITVVNESGLPYNAASLTTVKNTVGTAAQLTLRITRAENQGSFLERTVYGPFGVGTRQNTSGEIEVFSSRVFANIVPSTTITSVDVVQGTTHAFDLDVASAIRTVTVEHQRLTFKSFKTFDDQRIAQFAYSHAGIHVTPDGLVTRVERFERTNPDAGAIGVGEQSYEIPGMVQVGRGTYVDLEKWANGRAFEIFDRWGRGVIAMETELLRGGAGGSAKLGDEILVNLPQLPNKNKRLLDDGSVTARAMQIVHLTPTLRGAKVKLLDSGPNANAIATLPTHTIAASANQPKSIAEVTITNAATLNAAHYRVRVQMAVTSGAAPSVNDYTDVRVFEPDVVPTAAFALPAVINASAVYVRMRTEQYGSRPSNWTTGVGVTLSAITAPSAFTATPLADGSRCDLAWTNGDATAVTDVYIRKQSDPASANLIVIVLPPGSTWYTLDRLTPGTAYTATVQHRNEATGDTSAATTVNFTAGASAVTLPAPTYPDGFSFPIGIPGRLFSRIINGRATRYGIAVVATAHPSEVEIAEALETGIGAGTYGSFNTVGRVPSISGDWTIWSTLAPQDKLRRQLKARHVYDGMTASAYSAVVTVDPSTHDTIVAYPIGAPSAQITRVATKSNRETEVVSLNGSLGKNDPGPLQWRTKLGTAAFTGYVTTALPVELSVTKGAEIDTPLLLQVLQADGQTTSYSYNVPARGVQGNPGGDEDWNRSGSGGLTVWNKRVFAEAVYDQLGGTPVYDPATRAITTNLNDPNGRALYGGRMRCRLYKSGTQSIANDTFVLVTWDSEDYDIGGLHAGSSSKIIIPTDGGSGLWKITAYIAWAINGTGDRVVELLKNGVFLDADHRPACASLMGGVGITTDCTLTYEDSSPAVGDYYEVQVRQNSGGALNVGTVSRFMATHLS